MRPSVHFVDYDWTVRQLYKVCSPLRGLSATLSVDGPTCLKFLRQEQPAALVVDAETLTGGAAAVAALVRRAGDQLAEVPVFVTGDGPAEKLSIFSGVPVDRCFQKPFPVGQLLDAICQALFAPRNDAAATRPPPGARPADAGRRLVSQQLVSSPE